MALNLVVLSLQGKWLCDSADEAKPNATQSKLLG